MTVFTEICKNVNTLFACSLNCLDVITTDLLKVKPHSGQTYDLSPVWILSWQSFVGMVLNFLSQYEQLNGRSVLCLLSCRRRYLAVGKPRPQCVHANGRTPECEFSWFRTLHYLKENIITFIIFIFLNICNFTIKSSYNIITYRLWIYKNNPRRELNSL